MSDMRAESIGQLLLSELEEDRWSAPLERWLRAFQPGGILLSARSHRTPETMAELLSKIAASLPEPPILAIEEVGGKLDPLRAFFSPLPSPRALARKGLAAVTRMGELVGAGLKLLGFNAVLAPRLDLSAAGSNDSGMFSAVPRAVADCGGALLDGLERHKILACGKYFPGLGSAEVDPHSSMPLVGKTMVELWREDLVPYRELLPRLPLIMVGHGAYKAYDFDLPRPATLSSSVVEGLLRAKLGYRGVAITDDLASKAIRRIMDPQEAALKSLEAGCDLLRISGSPEKSAAAVLDALKGGLDSGKIPGARVEQALGRLRRVRKCIPLPGGKVSPRDFDRLARQFEKFTREFRTGEEEIA
jgi:beta-N-acetylhexosaminidase